MPITKNRRLSKILDLEGKVKSNLLDSDTIVTSGQKGVEVSSGVNFIVSSVDTLPVSTNTGHTALDSSTNRLYIFNGSGWYHIATINNFSPQWITQPNGTYTLAIDGSTTTITVLASDSDDVPLTYSTVTDSNFNAFATIAKSVDSDKHNVYIVTPTDSENGNMVGGTGTVTFKASDGINLVQAVSTFTLSFTVSNSNYSVALIKADSAQSDAQTDTTSNHTITEVGDVQSTAFTPYHPGGYSVYFGGDDWLSGADSVELSNDDFTAEIWLYKTATGIANILSKRGNTWASGDWSIFVELNATKIEFWNYDFSSSTYLLQGGAVSLNTWTHIAVTRSGDTWTLWQDGSSVHSVTSSHTVGNHSNPVVLGRDEYTGGRYYLTGYLRDARIIVGTALYTSTFTVPTQPLTAVTNTKFLSCNKPYIVDDSINDSAITNNGAVNERFGPYEYLGYGRSNHGGSVNFDGTGDYVTFPTSTNLNLGSGDFTIELWVYMTAYESTGFNTFIMPSASASPDWQLDYKHSTTQLRWLPYHSGTPDTSTLNVTQTLYTNQWYHIAVIRSGNFLSMYLNGRHLKTAPYNNTVDHDTSTTFYVGAREQGSTFDRRFTGYMSDLRIVKGTAIYDSDITVPTSPLTNVSGTGVLTFNNKNSIWDAARGRVLPKAGNTTASNTQRKFTSSSSVYFDGNGDSLSVPDADLLDFGTGDWTVEHWLYKSGSFKNYDSVWSKYVNPGGYWFHINNAGALMFGLGNITYATSTQQISLNTWHHIATVKNSNTIKVYIDGTATSISVSESTSNNQNTPFLIGALNGWTRPFEGYLQDFRVTAGLARYTSNFTAPTSTFTG